MAVNLCPTCKRFISISFVPGGNPVAKENPDTWALYYAKCESCGYIHCDRCVGKNHNRCPKCGAKVTIQGPPEQSRPIPEIKPVTDAPASRSGRKSLWWMNLLVIVISIILAGGSVLLTRFSPWLWMLSGPVILIAVNLLKVALTSKWYPCPKCKSPVNMKRTSPKGKLYKCSRCKTVFSYEKLKGMTAPEKSRVRSNYRTQSDRPFKQHLVRAIRSGNLIADAFEDRLLIWLQVRLGVKPTSRKGTNSSFWEIDFRGHKAELAVIGHRKNTSMSPNPGTDWILRVEEKEPLAVIPILERFFIPEKRLKRKMRHSGKIRVQFKSTDLLPDAELALK